MNPGMAPSDRDTAMTPTWLRTLALVAALVPPAAVAG